MEYIMKQSELFGGLAMALILGMVIGAILFFWMEGRLDRQIARRNDDRVKRIAQMRLANVLFHHPECTKARERDGMNLIREIRIGDTIQLGSVNYKSGLTGHWSVSEFGFAPAGLARGPRAYIILEDFANARCAVCGKSSKSEPPAPLRGE